MNNLSNEELVQVHATAREALLPVVWTEKKALAHFKSKITPGVVDAMARELLALREAGKEPVGFATKRNGNMGSWLFSTKSMAENHDSTALDGKPALSVILPLYAAPQLPAVPEGWVMVPDEPTEDMCFAPDVRVGNLTWDGHQSLADMHECREIYSAMIAAAPKPE